MSYKQGRLDLNIRGSFFEEMVAHLFGASGYTLERTGFEYRKSLLAERYGSMNIPIHEHYRPDLYINCPNQKGDFSVEVKACLRHQLSNHDNNEWIKPLSMLRRQAASWHSGNMPEIHPVYVVFVETAWTPDRATLKWPTFCAVAPENLNTFLLDGRSGMADITEAFWAHEVSFDEAVMDECRVLANLYVRMYLFRQAITNGYSDEERLKKLDTTARLAVETSAY